MNGLFGKVDDDHHHPPKIDVLPTNHPCREISFAAFKYVPQLAATTFAFASVRFSFYGLLHAGVLIGP